MKRIVMMFALLAASGVHAAGKADPAKAQPIVQQVCAACHAADGNSLVAANPRLAGQPAPYIYKQLIEFKKGTRVNAVMAGMVAALSDADMQNLAAYYSAQAPKPAQATDIKLVETGGKLYRGGSKLTNTPACMACHGPNGAGIPAQYPRLAGQHAAYIETQLKAYRAGERANDTNGMMRAVASRLTDNEIKALAQYVSGLK
jgi:cytochrome c553